MKIRKQADINIAKIRSFIEQIVANVLFFSNGKGGSKLPPPPYITIIYYVANEQVCFKLLYIF